MTINNSNHELSTFKLLSHQHPKINVFLGFKRNFLPNVKIPVIPLFTMLTTWMRRLELVMREAFETKQD